jgi:hypothetical protein
MAKEEERWGPGRCKWFGVLLSLEWKRGMLIWMRFYVIPFHYV